jgi:uncharacterized protein YjaG (DUF416 family)
MSILRYDEKEVLSRLQKLPNRLRVAFAAACAERQLPSYLSFSRATLQGNPDALARALGGLWNELEGEPRLDTRVRQDLDTCMSLLPDDDGTDPSVGHTVVYCAEDAVSAIAYAISTRLDGDPQQAAWAAYTAYTALDEYVQDLLGIESFDAGEEERIVSHPLVQAEFKRQRADLSQLEWLAQHPSEEKQGIAELRHRAQRDARVFFGP